MNFGDQLVGNMMRMLWIGTKVTFRLVGFGVGAAMNYANSRLGKYKPKQLSNTPPGEISADAVYAITILLPKTTEWDEQKAYRLMNQFGLYPEIGFELVADQGGITWQMVNWLSISPEEFERGIAAHFPSAVITFEPYTYHDQPTERFARFYRLTIPWQLGAIYPAPITTVDQIRQFDPLAPFTEALSHLQAGERVTFSVFVTGAFQEASDAGFKMIQQSDVSAFDFTSLDGATLAMLRKQRGLDQQARFEHSLDKPMREKLGAPLFHTLVFLQLDGATKERVEGLADTLSPHLFNFANPPLNALVPVDRSLWRGTAVTSKTEAFQTSVIGKMSQWLSGQDEGWRNQLLVLGASELAALWHLPHRDLTASQIRWINALQVPIPKALTDERIGPFIGMNRYGNRELPAFLPWKTRLSHVSIIGKTETGKSSLAHGMIHQDIAAGRPVFVMEPHGTLISSILQHSIPVGREKDVVILDIDQTIKGVYYPFPLNILGRLEGKNAAVAVGRFITILETIYTDMAARQMSDTLNALLMTLANEPNPTLLNLRKLMRDEGYRHQLLKKTRNLVAREFWEDMEGKDRELAARLNPVKWRLRGFYNSDQLLSITCHPDTLDLAELMRQGKIILVSLKGDEQAMPTQERWILGASIIAQIEMIALAGALTTPYTFYIDEAQNFVTTALPDMLSQVRKFNLGLVLINQFLDQLAGPTLKALLGNAGTLIGFEMGETDAKILDAYFKPEFETQSLLKLGKHRAAVTTRFENDRLPAFSLETVPPPGQGEANPQREAELRALSVATYTPKPYSEVINWIERNYGGTESDIPDEIIETDDDLFE